MTCYDKADINIMIRTEFNFLNRFSRFSDHDQLERVTRSVAPRTHARVLTGTDGRIRVVGKQFRKTMEKMNNGKADVDTPANRTSALW